MRKIIIILSFFFFLFGLQGCKKETYDEMAFYTTYQREEVDLHAIDDKERIWDIHCSKGKAVIATFLSDDDLTEGKRRIHLYEMDLGTKDIREIEFELESTTEMVRDITTDEQGHIYMLSQEPDGGEGFLSKIDTKQGLLERKIISEEILNYFESDSIMLTVDATGYVYLAGIMHLFVLDNYGEVYYALTEDVIIYNATEMKDGKLFASIMGAGFDKEYQFDIENKKWEQYTLLESYPNNEEAFNEELISGDEEFEFYFDDTGNVFANNIVWGIKDKRAYQLFKYEEANVLGENITHIRAIGECSFLCIENVGMGERFNQLVILKPASAEEATASEDKTKLHMVGYGISDDIKAAVYYFNQDNDSYYIDVKDYAIENGEEEEAIKKLNLELLEPGACDLIVLNRLPKDDYIAKEMLSDLSPFLGQSEVINKESFLDGIMQILTDEQGAIHFMIPEFSIQTVVKKGESGQVQTDDYFLALEESNESLEEGQSLFYHNDKESLLETLIRYNPNSLVHEKDKTCSFDSEEFRRILRLVDSADTKEIDVEVSMPESIRNGQLLMVDWDVEHFLQIMLLDHLFEQNAEFIGYSTQKGRKQVIEGNGLEIGILNTSEQKQGAWEFFEYVFQKENYDKLFGITQFPVRKDSLEDSINLLSATEPYTKEDGTVVEPMEDMEVGFEDYVINPGPLNERQIQIFEELCNNAVYAETMDEKYMEIILEETKSYFNNQKSEDEVVLTLQNRIGNALKE